MKGWLTLKEAAEKYTFDEKTLLLMIAGKRIRARAEKINGSLLSINEEDVSDLGFIRQRHNDTFIKHLKRGVLSLIETAGAALVVETLKRRELPKLVRLL